MVENLLKVIHILEGLQQAEHLRMLNVYVGCNLQRSATDSLRTRTDLGIPNSTVSEILTQDLSMECVMAKFIPRLLLPEQKEYRAVLANDLIQTATNEPDFLKETITLEGTEASLSFVQCFLYLVSSSINVSVFHITWLDTFYICICCI